MRIRQLLCAPCLLETPRSQGARSGGARIPLWAARSCDQDGGADRGSLLRSPKVALSPESDALGECGNKGTGEARC
ncbi:hypothetical protein NDU88_005639 [Pleurodeles waltl]|uniref:Uncharacterized protein n=1 Tax=Pleurodeles waltl TaxID=8319 RepID=A0AAV7LNE3_PLEWA|nr:hypothetical protein NDU88_005639 [Pleurodeles waltl]